MKYRLLVLAGSRVAPVFNYERFCKLASILTIIHIDVAFDLACSNVIFSVRAQLGRKHDRVLWARTRPACVCIAFRNTLALILGLDLLGIIDAMVYTITMGGSYHLLIIQSCLWPIPRAQTRTMIVHHEMTFCVIVRPGAVSAHGDL